ncbi:MAG: hypothetical protein ACKOWG_09495, partial [Planctomycetia bacterium]
MTTSPLRAGLLVAAALTSLCLGLRSEAQPPAGTGAPAANAASATRPQPPAADDDDDDGDLARKAEIMNSSRWRRAIFELGEWLSAQVIYTPTVTHFADTLERVCIETVEQGKMTKDL